MIPEHLLQPCDIVLVQGVGPISRCIRWFTDSPWSHGALYLGGGMQTLAESTEMGVHTCNLQTLVRGHTRYCVLRYPGLTVEQSEAIKDRAYRLAFYEHHGYNFAGLVSQGLYQLLARVGIRWKALVAHRKNRYFCTEFIATCFAAGGRPLGLPKLATPASLYNDTRLVRVWEKPL